MISDRSSIQIFNRGNCLLFSYVSQHKNHRHQCMHGLQMSKYGLLAALYLICLFKSILLEKYISVIKLKF